MTPEMRDRAYDASLIQVLVREATHALQAYNDLTVMENVPPTLARAAIEGVIDIFADMAQDDSDMQTAVARNARLRAFRSVDDDDSSE